LGDYPQNPARLSGGVEAVVLYLVQRLQSYPDLKVEVITLGPRGSQRRTVQYDQVPVHYLPRVRWPSRLSILGNIYQMRAEVLRLKPDLVHAQIAGEYAEAAVKSGLPWLLTLHGIRFLEAELWSGWLSRYYRGWFIKREEFQAVRKAKHLISISPFIQEVFQRQIKGQVYTIENPIADDFFQLHHCEKPYQLLFIGRLIPRKGVHTLLQAFAQLHQRMPEARLRLAGGPAPANESDQ
jgi:glycosyltransferase involved in cell wall biosynthesis